VGIVDLPEIDDYFYGDFCTCSILRWAMTLKRFKKICQYLHLNDEEQRSEPHNKNYDILYKARPALDRYYKQISGILPTQS
jgi:hypothetical protein